MPTPKQPSEHPNWEQLIEEYRKSGLGVRKWCEKNNVPFFKSRYRLHNPKKIGNQIPVWGLPNGYRQQSQAALLGLKKAPG